MGDRMQRGTDRVLKRSLLSYQLKREPEGACDCDFRWLRLAVQDRPEPDGSLSKPSLEFGHLGSVTEGVSDALAEGRREFRSVEGVVRQRKTLLTPDLPPYGAKAVGEGWPLLVVPGAG